MGVMQKGLAVSWFSAGLEWPFSPQSPQDDIYGSFDVNGQVTINYCIVRGNASIFFDSTI